MKNEDKNAKKPISSGIAPGPGEHLADEPSHSPKATSTASDSIGAAGDTTGMAGTDGATLFGSADSNQVDNTSRTAGTTDSIGNNGNAVPRVQSSPSSPYEAASAGLDNSVGGQQGQNAASTMLQSAQNLIERSPGPLLAGVVVAGFLLQRFLGSSSAQTSQRPYRTYTPETLRAGYGGDSSFESNRKYRADSPYARDTAYPSSATARSSNFSTGNIDRIADRVKQASENARTKLQVTTADARARLDDMSHLTRSQYYRAKDRVGTAVEAQPWLIGVLGIAVGTGLGAILATTRRGNTWLGSMRSNWMGKTGESDQFSTIQEGTSTAYGVDRQAGSSVQKGSIGGSYQPEL